MAAESKTSLPGTLRRRASFFLGAALLSSVASAQSEHWRDVKDAALRDLFQDKEFADGVHFAYRFKRDGTFIGTEMAKDVSGSWRVRGGEFCWHWLSPPGPHECYTVERDGGRVRMLINGSEAWYGTLR